MHTMKRTSIHRSLSFLGAAALALGALSMLSGAQTTAPAPAPPVAPQPPTTLTTHLTIDFVNGFEMRYTLKGLKEGSTALDVMLAAREHARPLVFQYKGEGRRAFLQSIEGVANELKGPESRNWLYWVNGAFAKVGMGQQEVHDGDEVLWRFGVYKDEVE